jgi:outer membrane protein OmpA-like peptidoglycan-associated protein
MEFSVFYNLNSATLDSKAKAAIKTQYRSLKSKLTSQSQVTVRITGWVQPTVTSPNVQGLSYWRAKSVALYLQELGLKAKILIKSPGHDKLNVADSRRASTVITWSNSQ